MAPFGCMYPVSSEMKITGIDLEVKKTILNGLHCYER